MTRSERETLQKRIVQFHINHAKNKKNVTANHFMKEKIPRQTIYSITRKYEESGLIGDKPRSVCSKRLRQQRLDRLKQLVNHKTGVSIRLLARKFKVSHQTIYNYLEEMNIKYY